MSDATVLLGGVEQGDPRAADQLLDLVYEELRRLASYKMAHEVPGQTLQPTALVHEAWLKLVGAGDRKFENRAHFFAVAAEAMRRILIDRARRRQTQRHGGQYERVELEETGLAAPAEDGQLLAVDEALQRLSREYPAPGRGRQAALLWRHDQRRSCSSSRSFRVHSEELLELCPRLVV